MRSIPVFMWVLAQFSKFRTPSDLSDGLKTGAFDAPLPLAQASLTEPHSGAVPFRWTAIKVMIQSCEIPIVASVQLTNVPRYQVLAAKRLQTDCVQTEFRPQFDCKRTAHSTSIQESGLSLCRSKLFATLSELGPSV